MILTEHVRCAFDDAQGEKPEAALLHACIAIDATAKRLYSSETSSRKRFVRCIRDYYWLIEPMMGVGLNLQETIFDNITLPRQPKPPDFADVVYAIHRNSHAHGDEVPLSFKLTKSDGPNLSYWEMSADELRIPDRLIWALLSVAVFCRANHKFKGWGESRYLTWSYTKFMVSESWGRENELRPLALTWNTTRVKLEGLGRLKDAANKGEARSAEYVIIAASPP